MANNKVEATPLTEAQIEQAVGIFAPSNADVASRVTFVLDTMDANGCTAKDVFTSVKAHYDLLGKRLPRGMALASVTNSATTGKLWTLSGIGRTKVTADNVTRTYADMIGLIDTARNAHDKRTVQALITETLSTLQTDVKPAVRYRALWDALEALVERAPESKESKSAEPTFAAFLKRVAALRDYVNSIPDDAWNKGREAITEDDRESVHALRAILQNV